MKKNLLITIFVVSLLAVSSCGGGAYAPGEEMKGTLIVKNTVSDALVGFYLEPYTTANISELTTNYLNTPLTMNNEKSIELSPGDYVIVYKRQLESITYVLTVNGINYKLSVKDGSSTKILLGNNWSIE